MPRLLKELDTREAVLPIFNTKLIGNKLIGVEVLLFTLISSSPW